MTAYIYNINEDPRVANKSVDTRTDSNRVDVDIWGECSIYNPVFIVRNISTPFTVNYIYVADTNIYYFVEDIVVDKNRVFYKCRADALTTLYKTTGLKDKAVQVVRQENAGITMVYDSELPLSSKWGLSYFNNTNSTLINNSNAISGARCVLLCTLGG